MQAKVKNYDFKSRKQKKYKTAESEANSFASESIIMFLNNFIGYDI